MYNKKKFIENLKDRDEAVTITIGNQKGGVGKTTNGTMICYSLAKMGIKSLIIDLDPQANATKSMLLTKSNHSEEIFTVDKTIMAGVQDDDLTDLPVNIMPNLDLLPSYSDFKGFTRFLYRNTQTDYEVDHYLEHLIQPLKKEYDVIFIDIPPFSIETTNNAAILSDYVLISLQTQERSMTGAEDFLKTLSAVIEKYNLDTDILGIIEVLQKKKGSVDQYIMDQAKEEFGQENIFETVIPQMERLKRFDVNGIEENDYFDKQVVGLYNRLAEEFLKRLNHYLYE
ncbi:Chromosome-partitioning ATPase Soj (plasmid) [Apilactobacillus kunkeei]|nr:Chromosome-partitioning ATPase Soj [Apilactobacillus kunkeei]CAI2669148.1 Chromosome-partitioning ATPase Soj [Apilactobacillus kunkeei]CAI2803549.1 Chromosome-partitioning ATPase Soj [Apilactobacillus kunkeei]